MHDLGQLGSDQVNDPLGRGADEYRVAILFLTISPVHSLDGCSNRGATANMDNHHPSRVFNG